MINFKFTDFINHSYKFFNIIIYIEVIEIKINNLTLNYNNYNIYVDN
jgi:hypothetical protein